MGKERRKKLEILVDKDAHFPIMKLQILEIVSFRFLGINTFGLC